MPFRSWIDSEHRRIRIVAEGRLSPKHYEEFFEGFSTDGAEAVLDCLSDSGLSSCPPARTT